MLYRFMEKAENSKDKDPLQLIFLTERFCIYSQPTILMFTFDIKRIEAAQWSLEAQKMLRGIEESTRALGTFIDQVTQNKRLFVEGNEITMSPEMLSWTATYIVDNAVLRIYACLDKLSQMCRCYFEQPVNGGKLTSTQKCKCEEPLNDVNCTFGKLLNSLHRDPSRNQEIFASLKKIDNHESIKYFRKHRNEFTHGKHSFDRSKGIDPKVKVKELSEGELEASINLFGGASYPSFYTLREKIIEAHNALVESIEEIGEIIFPSDFELKKKVNKA